MIDIQHDRLQTMAGKTITINNKQALDDVSCDARKPVFGAGFPTKSDTNQSLQLQKMARILKFWVEVEEELYYSVKRKQKH